jgi:3'-phosphoadenosine 5'-phosphosulfate sulfotransferase (PAPS reductase)/FAD synthetase
VFFNTGRERKETLEFVERCSQRWGVVIVWLEYRYVNGGHTFVIVDFATASRDGEPFDELLRHRKEYRESKGLPLVLPNPVQRFCTTEMKIRTCDRYVKRHLGWATYTDALGLRADEPKRVLRLRQKRQTTVEPTLYGEEKTVTRASSVIPGTEIHCPLYDAGATEDDVMAFWKAQPFNLGLESYQGNCDLCFLKSAQKILRVMRESPELAAWWIRKEEETGARFRNDRPGYAELLAIAQGKQEGPGWLWADKGNDGSCGEMDECRCTD